MINWVESMNQTFEYYIVDPYTWKDMKPINTITSSSIDRDSDTDLIDSASISTTESLGECYIRIYLIAIQNGIKEKVCLGTFLVQTPSRNFNGMNDDISLDAYSPILELKEKQSPIGYTILKNSNIMDNGYRIVRDNVRCPVVKPDCKELLSDNFVSNLDETWPSFVRDLIAHAKYEIRLDEMSRILFAPKQNTASLQPVWTYDDSNSSILLPDITVNRDLYGIPNVVEVIYSSGRHHYYGKAINDDPNSPISTISRGREIVHRITDPNLSGLPSQLQVQNYATEVLKELSSLEYTVTYSHGYCPVRLGDCVRLNYERAGIVNVKAKVIKQSIKCTTGCQVSETATFTNKLWG